MATRIDPTTKIAALGRSIQPGMLYDYRTEKVISDIFLWGEDVTPKTISCQSSSTNNRCAVGVKDTFTENGDLLGIDDNVKLSVVASLVDLSGASILLRNRRTTNRNLRLVFKHSIVTHIRSLTMSYASKQYTKYPEVFDQKMATHVVTDVLYGAQFIVVFHRTIFDNEDVKSIQESLVQLLEKIPSFRFTSNDQLIWNDHERKLAESLTCRYHGDLQLPSDAKTFEQVVRLYKEFPKLLGANNKYAIPQQVTIYPLYLLDDLRSTEKRFHQIDNQVLSRALELIDKLRRFYVILNDLTEDINSLQLFDKSKQQLSILRNEFGDCEDDIEGQMRSLLPEIRSGSVKETALINLFTFVNFSKEQNEKFNDWIRHKTQEIRILANMLKDLKRPGNIDSLIGSFADFQRQSKHEIIFRLIIHVTERKSPFLKDLFRSFDQHVKQQNAQIDCWYDDKNLPSIQNQVVRFIQVANDHRNQQNIHFIVNEEHADDFQMNKGASILLYQNGVPVNFEFPNKPGRPQVADASSSNITLRWTPPTCGNRSIIKYAVYGRNPRNQQWQLFVRTKDATTSVVIPNLNPGQYEFAVQGYTLVNATEYSDASNIIRVETPRPISPVHVVKSTPAVPKVAQQITTQKATIDVTPAWCEQVKPIPLEKTRLPPEFDKNSPTDVRTYQCLATYRSMKNKTKNIDFVVEPFKADVENTETLVVVLNELANQLGTRLTFTNSDFKYDDSAYRTACGVANLGSIHTFLASEGQFQTAKFTLHLNLDYDNLTATPETLQKFVVDSINDISSVVGCKKEFIRVFEVQRTQSIYLSFGITTPVIEETKTVAEKTKDQLNEPSIKRRGGIFEHLIPERYEFKRVPVPAQLQIQEKDLERVHNRSYDFAHEERRGGKPYYFPEGWYRHALRVVDKYPEDKAWLKMDNSPGEWAVAYHGTKSLGVRSIVDHGLSQSKVVRDIFKPVAEMQNPSIPKVNGLYVATHCQDGASVYAEPFDVKEATSPGRKCQVVFQCRVQPGRFTVHEKPGVVTTGDIWRVFDEKAIRPYGLLLKYN
ncbi:unnamed protein product [Adineta ricciae]|uniref:Fibronectin type-III domain-containing protein n=1 Tax=Adineta ricciae TaxID=249248 RepID=A0A814ITR7_ADIRI|nr:unnamed protein product [Adineta ricciae]CAF1195683.1 unnamed protein product [Adineta ricciae]